MAKNAYLIVTDLHMWNGNLANRYDYQSEMAYVCETMVSIAARYRKSGYNVSVIYGGDVFHRGYRLIDDALRDSSFFHLWNKKFGEQYVCVGNHELTYTKNNPFYSLVSELTSEKLKDLNKLMPVRGSYPVFKVQDTLEDGNVVFHFNHYKTAINVPIDGKVNVGIFHQDICSQDIIDATRRMLKDENAYVVSEKRLGFEALAGYQYSFLCHMHKVVGIWGGSNNSIIAALGSLGRTNVTEVNNDFLTRVIPVVKVVDGNLEGVEAEQFDLLPFEQCVNEHTLQASRDKYQIQKVAKETKQYRPVGDDPIVSLDNFLGDNEFAREIMRAVIDSRNSYDLTLQRKVQEVLGR